MKSQLSPNSLGLIAFLSSGKNTQEALAIIGSSSLSKLAIQESRELKLGLNMVLIGLTMDLAQKGFLKLGDLHDVLADEA